MDFIVYQSGVTGPSYTIGGSSAYHIDSKFSTSLGEERARELFEAKVEKYNELGRDVVFSNRAVAGIVYRLDLPISTRTVIFRRAYQAHAYRHGWYSLDYYAPFIGKSRWHWSAQRAPIFAVTYEGGSRRTGFAWNYGFYSAVYDKHGRLIAKVGHGDNRYPTYGGGTLVKDTTAVETEPVITVVCEPESDELSPAQVGFKYEQTLASQY